MTLMCSLGITAHNEEANIGQLLEAIVNQELEQVTLDEIIVVASGCTDRTEEIVTHWAARDSRIRLLVQPEREGKASALNWFIREAGHPILVLSSADLIPTLTAVEKLVRPFSDPEVGITASHPQPVNDPTQFLGFSVHMLWNLHHEINMMGLFKCGEMIAFRKIFERIPNHTAVDEASVEPIVRAQGYKWQYVADAIVYNKGPETIDDFIRQRRRIHAGHLELERDLGYKVSTMNGRTILRAFLNNLEWRPRPLAWSCATAALEVYGRWLGQRDFKQQRSHTVWEIATTTKQLEI